MSKQRLRSTILCSRILKNAVDFHGHLGPYLVLGLKMGELAIDKLKCRKHFGISAVVKGAVNKPQSCLIDGIQLSTGCTYGKGNIRKIKHSKIQALFVNLENNKKIRILFKEALIKKLSRLKWHKDSERFAKTLITTSASELFDLYS